MDITKLSFFIAAAEANSLSLGAKRVGVQVSTVSRAISDLEETLKVQLLARTGRGVRLTLAGERFLPRAKNILQEMASAAAEARGEKGPQLARLRISAPLTFSLQLLPTCIVALLKKYPTLQIETHAEARRVSLLEEDYDAAIRLGAINDAALIVQPLGVSSLVLCAPPKLAPTIRSVRNIEKIFFVSVNGTPNYFPVTHNKKEIPVQQQISCHVSTFLEAAEVASRLPLLVLLPAGTAVPFLLKKKLRIVLPNYTPPRVKVNLVHTTQTRGDFIIKELGGLLSDALQTIEGQLLQIIKKNR